MLMVCTGCALCHVVLAARNMAAAAARRMAVALGSHVLHEMAGRPLCGSGAL